MYMSYVVWHKTLFKELWREKVFIFWPARKHIKPGSWVQWGNVLQPRAVISAWKCSPELPTPPQLSLLTLRHLFLSAEAMSLSAACELFSLCSWFLPIGKCTNGDSEGGDTRTTHYTLEWPVPHKGSCGYSDVCGWNYDSEARKCIYFLQWGPCFPHCDEALRGTGWRRERIGFGSGFQRLRPVGRWIQVCVEAEHCGGRERRGQDQCLSLQDNPQWLASTSRPHSTNLLMKL